MGKPTLADVLNQMVTKLESLKFNGEAVTVKTHAFPGFSAEFFPERELRLVRRNSHALAVIIDPSQSLETTTENLDLLVSAFEKDLVVLGEQNNERSTVAIFDVRNVENVKTEPDDRRSHVVVTLQLWVP